MKSFYRALFILTLVLTTGALSISLAHASVTPTLSLYATGTGDNVQVTVTGDPNVSVLLYYVQSGSGPQIATLGTTNSGGVFSTTVSSATYGIVSGSQVHVILNGTGGLQSPVVVWPTVSSTNNLTLSQTGVVLSPGQSSTITATNLFSSGIYVANNSNPSIANVSVSGTSITIAANTNGQTTVTLCPVGNTTNCPSVYVIVQSSGAAQLSFSQNNVTLAAGQNVPITISGGSGIYIVFNNSNTAAVQTGLSGSVLTLSTSYTSGTASLTVCTTNSVSCGIINVTIQSANTSSLTLSDSAPTVAVGQTSTVYLYGPSGSTFYVSSNSNPSIAQINVSGNTLTITGIANGSGTVSVCASTGSCGTLTLTVNYQATGGAIALSQNTLSVAAGQNLSITVSGGTAPYSISGGSSSIAQVTLNGNVLTIYGIAQGTSLVQVCSSAGGCVLLTITVGGGSSSGSALSLSQNTLSLGSGQGANVTIYGSGTYYLSNNTNAAVASALVSGSTLTVTGLSAGNDSIVVCQSASVCSTLVVTVAGSGGVTSALTQNQIQAVVSLLQSFGANQTMINTMSSVMNGNPITVQNTTSSGSVTQVGNSYVFTKFLTIGSTGTEVTELQKKLTALGLYTGPITGRFGAQTQAAVKKFQAAHSLTQAGYVGIGTRAALNSN